MRNLPRPHNHFARAASAALAVLVCAGPATPVAADDAVRRPTYDRAVLSKIAHDVLRRAVNPVESVAEPAAPGDPQENGQDVPEPTADVPPSANDLMPAVEGITVAIPPGARALTPPLPIPHAGYDSNSGRQRPVATRGLSFSSGVRAPASGIDPALRAHVRGLRGQGREFVYGFLLLRVATDEALERTLAGLGVTLLGRHDDHYKARLPVNSLELIAALPEVEWIGVSSREQKQSLELAQLRGAGAKVAGIDRVTPIPIAINLFDGDADGEFGRQLEAAGAALGEYDDELHFYRAVASGPVIDRIAALDFVLFVELIGLTAPGHDQSTPMVDADLIRPGRTSYGLTRFSGGPIPVGIIDSGADINHRELAFKRVCGRNFSPEMDGAFVDLNGHGTHVLATIAGKGHNARYKGVAPGLGAPEAGGSIRVAKVYGKNQVSGTNEAVESAMDWMALPGLCDNQPAPLLVNYSGGSPVYPGGGTGTEPLARKVDYRTWINRQLYTVCSGDDGPLAAHGTIRTPGNAKNALTVGSVYDFGYQAVGDIYRNSSRGPTGDGRMKPNVVAPGSIITSAKAGTLDEYVDKSGCSSATAHVTGLAATLMQHYPQFQFNPALVRAHLMATAMGHDGAVDPSDDYGLGRVSGYIAHWDHPNSDGWETHRSWGTVNSFGFAYSDITVPPGAKRLVVVLTWDEPPASAGASRAVLYYMNLYVDRGIDCADPTGACGEYMSVSSVDNVEYVVIHDPQPGTYRLKVVPHDASATVLPWGMSAVVIRGDVLPQTRVAPPSPAMRAYTTVPDFDVEVGRGFAVTVGVANDSYVASGVRIEPVLIPSGVEARHIETVRLDGEIMSFVDGTVPVTLGNIPPSWSRPATYVYTAKTPGAKAFQYLVWSENSGEILVRATVNVVPAAVDLTVSLLAMTSAAPAAAPGSTLTVTDTVHNQGPGASASSKVRYYLSEDAVKSAGDVLMTGTHSVPGLASGASHTATVTLTVPAGTPLNDYFLLACADDLSAIAESSEGNNCTATPGAIVTVGRPDLIVNAVSAPPATAVPGGKFSVTSTTQNLGAVVSGSSSTRFYLSLNRTKDAGDKLLSGSRATAGPAPGASQSGTVVVTIPTSTPLNTYFLLACADDQSKVVEINETNNCTASATPVTVIP